MSAGAHVCSWSAHVHEHWCTWQHERLCSCQRTVRVTRGVLRGRRSTVISPAASSSRKARYFAKRVTPSFSSWPFGRGKLEFLVFQAACSNRIQTNAFGVLVALVASIAHHIGTFTNAAVFFFMRLPMH